ncbi:MAG: hypothetical protein JKY19_07430 [Alcanivoracaceae bacterium]|nr:hypothetical protein [Alcanivoracaceae bacterium]
MHIHKHVFFFLLIIFITSTTVQAQQISGTIIDSSTNNPIAGALVTLHGGSVQVFTATDGSYSMDVSGIDLLIIGAAKGYFYQSATSSSPASGIVIALDPVPLTDNSAYEIRPPTECGGCHPKQYDNWINSPMAKAGFNTWVNDIYNGDGTPGGAGGFVYTRDSVFAHSNPNSECASCHQPQSWIDSPFSALDSNVNTPTPSVQHGVSCDICHKVADVDVTKINSPGIFPGAVSYNRPNSGTQVQYGVLGDVTYNIPSLMRASYQPQMRAELCAACHQDAADPNEDHSYSGVISEPTYLEWLASDYANPASASFADCVDCHMGASPDNRVCGVIVTPPRPVESVRNHMIEGSTPAYLENAVDLDLQVSSTHSQINVQVSIHNNQTGHHVPTGVTVRNMILLVEAWQEGNDPLTDSLLHTGTQSIHELGGIGDPAQGYYAGLAGKFYAKVNHDINGNGPTFFTDATGIQFDNRIPANQSDTTNYTFQLPDHQADIKVRARLIYRKAFRFLVDAKNWTEDGHGQPLADVAAPHFGHLMESAETTINAGTNVIPFLSFKSLIMLFALLLGFGLVSLLKLRS